jgi:hypothetical protein
MSILPVGVLPVWGIGRALLSSRDAEELSRTSSLKIQGSTAFASTEGLYNVLSPACKDLTLFALWRVEIQVVAMNMSMGISNWLKSALKPINHTCF